MPTTATQKIHAQNFRALHALNVSPLLLPNAWDAASAGIMVKCGAPAIATTSAGVSWSHGFSDGEQLPREAHVATIREIVRLAAVPVTVDVEGGYSDDPEAVAKFIAEIIAAGAVGINLEDGASSPDLLAAKISAAKAVAKRVGVDLFINARTDVYLRRLVSPDLAVSETIKRAKLYQNAGADGIFVPVLVNLDEMRQIAEVVPLPINVMVLPGIAPVQVLKEHGVRRISVGPALMQTAMAAAQKAAMEILHKGRFDALFSATVSFEEMNKLFAGR